MFLVEVDVFLTGDFLFGDWVNIEEVLADFATDDVFFDDLFDVGDLNRTIEDYLVDTVKNSETKTIEDEKYTKFIVKIDIKEKSQLGTLYEEFLLRQDEDGKWKILGWRRVDKDGLVTN